VPNHQPSGDLEPTGTVTVPQGGVDVFYYCVFITPVPIMCTRYWYIHNVVFITAVPITKLFAGGGGIIM
jgi:hypothetical protein